MLDSVPRGRIRSSTMARQRQQRSRSSLLSLRGSVLLSVVVCQLIHHLATGGEIELRRTCDRTVCSKEKTLKVEESNWHNKNQSHPMSPQWDGSFSLGR
jgi:hypothetical protein